MSASEVWAVTILVGAFVFTWVGSVFYQLRRRK